MLFSHFLPISTLKLYLLLAPARCVSLRALSASQWGRAIRECISKLCDCSAQLTRGLSEYSSTSCSQLRHAPSGQIAYNCEKFVWTLLWLQMAQQVEVLARHVESAITILANLPCSVGSSYASRICCIV